MNADRPTLSPLGEGGRDASRMKVHVHVVTLSYEDSLYLATAVSVDDESDFKPRLTRTLIFCAGDPGYKIQFASDFSDLEIVDVTLYERSAQQPTAPPLDK